eukprot:scaffold240_cov369-Pavlova_lutheri.AAC.34
MKDPAPLLLNYNQQKTRRLFHHQLKLPRGKEHWNVADNPSPHVRTLSRLASSTRGRLRPSFIDGKAVQVREHPASQNSLKKDVDDQAKKNSGAGEGLRHGGARVDRPDRLPHEQTARIHVPRADVSDG